MTEDMFMVGRVAPQSKALNMQLDQARFASASKDVDCREMEEYRAAPCSGSIFQWPTGSSLCCSAIAADPPAEPSPRNRLRDDERNQRGSSLAQAHEAVGGWKS